MLQVTYELTSQPNVEDVMCDPLSSYWLKSVLKQALERDALDSIRDIEVVHSILHARLQRLGVYK